MTTSTTVKFVGSDAAGLPLKRKQVTQACPSCRKKKKRCIHADEESDDRPDSRSITVPAVSSLTASGTTAKTHGQRAQSLPQGPLPPQQSSSPSEDASQAAASGLVELSSHWVCDMNPESVLIPAATEHQVPVATRDKDDIGVWGSNGADDVTNGAGPNGLSPAQLSPRGHPPPRATTSKSQIAQEYEAARRRYLLEDCLATLPPEKDYAQLKRIFMRNVHPIFPILKESAINATDDSTLAIVTKQLISLVAAPDSSASSHLRLTPSGHPLTFASFHNRLSAAIIDVLQADMIPNRMDHVRILILLSIFYQPATPHDRGKAALLCTEAYHYFVTRGAHLQGSENWLPNDDIDGVFCALWALDRLSAAMNSQPILLHTIDVGKDVEACINKQPTGFRLLLSVVKWLDKIINLYRPRQPFEVVDIPPLETLIVESGALKLPNHLLATIEVLYHATALLSCRQPSKLSKVLPHPSINARRSLSADRIVWSVQNESLAAFVFVPYAVSLSLSVAYRKVRWCSTPMFRKRGRVWFQQIVTILKGMEDVWVSARINAKLGDAIIKEMEKTVERVGREDDDERAGTGGGGGPTAPAINTEQNTPATITTTKIGTDITPGSVAVDTISAPQGPAGATISMPTELSQSDWAGMETSMFDVDLFSYFDPSFDLGAVDTALEANLDMGMPQNNWATSWEGFIGSGSMAPQQP